jgi:hypothetical protein
MGHVIVLKQDAQRLDQAARAKYLSQFHLD